MRSNQRALDALRPVEMLCGFHHPSEGSVLYRIDSTVVLCTVSMEASVPSFLEGKGKGWLTAEYQMHPRASAFKREAREGRGKNISGRTQEIQRLIGRALRGALDLEKLGERTIVVDCDVLEADGGTRTASVTGGFVALALALHSLHSRGVLKEPVLRDTIAAVSVGCLPNGVLALDLIYTEDSKAEMDLNVVATGSGKIIEIQGTAEGSAMPRTVMDAMIDLSLAGIARLSLWQKETLQSVGVSLDSLLIPRASK